MHKEFAMSKSFLVLLSLGLSPIVWSMQPMTDEKMAEMTGQDGMTIGVNMDQIVVDRIALIDTNGLAGSTTLDKRSGFVVAGENSTTPISLTFNGNNATNPSLKAVIDSDGGTNNNAFVNIGLSFSSNITGLTISPLSVYLAGVNAISTKSDAKSIFNGTNLQTNVKQILRLNDGLDIHFKSGNSPRANIQLGHSPQGQIVRLGGAISSICTNNVKGCNIKVVDGNTGIDFGFQFTAFNPATGFDLAGFYTSIKPDGVEIGNVGTSSKFNLKFNALTLGTVGQSSTEMFKAIPNGPIGNIGMDGVSVKDLKMHISGL